MIKLIRYLPEYYQESRQMNAIMNAAEREVPDVDQELSKVFFLTVAPDKWLYLWQAELAEQNREALLAKLRSSGILSLETLQAMGLTALETYKLSPEDGFTLSGDDSMLPDGEFFGPLISTIFASPENIEVVRNLIKISGLAGFSYWYAVCIEERATQSTGRMGSLRSLYTGITMEAKLGYDELSGPPVSTGSTLSSCYGNGANAYRMPWWSPNVHFLDNLAFTEEVFATQQSSVTIVKEE